MRATFMIQPMTKWQKVVAYASLIFVLAWTVWGLYAIWLIVTRGA
jgi:hypothetical protein